MRNIPVLAEKAAHVAAGRAHREYSRTRQKMVERLLLDRINLQRCGRTIAEAVKFAALIDAYEAKSGLPFPDVAMPRAEIAMRAAIGRGLPPTRLVQLLGSLEHFQIFHCQPLLLLSTLLYASHMLRAAALIHPIEKVADAGALAPHQFKIFAAIKIRRVCTVKRFHAPVDVRAVPGMQPVAFRRDPVIAKRHEDASDRARHYAHAIQRFRESARTRSERARADDGRMAPGPFR